MRREQAWQEAEQRILQIAVEVDQRPSPDDIVEDARSETSPLHSFFDWDDESAATSSRRKIARNLIRRVRFEVHVDEKTIAAPGFYRDPDLEHCEPGYVAYPVVMENDGMAMRVCLAEFDRAKSVLKRAILSAQALKIECGDGQKALVFVEKMIKQLTA